jgi:hypothetical protein
MSPGWQFIARSRQMRARARSGRGAETPCSSPSLQFAGIARPICGPAGCAVAVGQDRERGGAEALLEVRRGHAASPVLAKRPRLASASRYIARTVGVTLCGSSWSFSSRARPSPSPHSGFAARTRRSVRGCDCPGPRAPARGQRERDLGPRRLRAVADRPELQHGRRLAGRQVLQPVADRVRVLLEPAQLVAPVAFTSAMARGRPSGRGTGARRRAPASSKIRSTQASGSDIACLRVDEIALRAGMPRASAMRAARAAPPLDPLRVGVVVVRPAAASCRASASWPLTMPRT